MTVTVPAGTLEKALERNLPDVEHDRPLPSLMFILGNIYSHPFTLVETRIPRPCSQGKCSCQHCPMQRGDRPLVSGPAPAGM